MKPILTLLLIVFCFVADAQNEPKAELKKLADDLTQQIKQKGNKRLAVASFTDLQNNETELGRYLAQQFSNVLIRNGLDVVDRSRIDILMNENKMSAKGLLDPATQAKLGRLAGIEIIIVGSTTPLDQTVELTISAIDITRGSSIAATDGGISRTEAINSLLRSNIGKENGSVQDSPFVPVSSNQDVGSALMGDKKMDLPKETCNKGVSYFGQVCFENLLKQPLVLYYIDGPRNYVPKTLFGANARNCTELIYTGASSNQNVSCAFYFHTAEEEASKWRYGKMSVIVEGCKVVLRAINTDRLFLSKNKPD
jgi:TolB-like protein